MGLGAAEGTSALDADFSTAGIAAVRARRMRWKLCSSTRYEAMDDLPAQIPGWRQQAVGGCWGTSCLRTVQSAWRPRGGRETLSDPKDDQESRVFNLPDIRRELLLAPIAAAGTRSEAAS